MLLDEVLPTVPVIVEPSIKSVPNDELLEGVAAVSGRGGQDDASCLKVKRPLARRA
jgi:hypothetical protein